eukprot:TRINITY_DN915_c0_g1_i7.p1 TRINITY_DN915_c0_g1~~TRINITY_DN915_c0_g1_i7.p1  ORF type:complete len:125 (+),score=16.11 TRINITY_DN915_c0_g1_i7:97-471(+)
MEADLGAPTYDSEKGSHKLKRLVQAPNSYFMDVKCPNCQAINTVFSHAKIAVYCQNCGALLGKPTGGKTKLTIGSSYKIKNQERSSDLNELKHNTLRNKKWIELQQHLDEHNSEEKYLEDGKNQ